MRTRSLLAPALMLVLSLLVLGAPAISVAEPVCPDPADREPCGGRVFPEPIDSQTALTYAETVAGLQALEAEFDDWVDVTTFGTSFDGFDLVMAEMTDPASTIPLAERKVVLVSQSIHGNEAGGREGGVRYLEDLLRGLDPAVGAVLDRVRLVQVFPNPDGWAAGDHDQVSDGDSLGFWSRGNGNGLGIGDLGGVDLNRNAPWYGFVPDGRPDPVSEPEMQALVAEVERRLGEGQDIQASVDIHGEVPDAAAVTMLSAGEFDLQEMMSQRAHGDGVVAAVTEAFTPQTRAALRQQIGDVPPAILHASSEFGPVGVGGSGSGFLGDWIAQQHGGRSASLSTIELLNQGEGPGFNSRTFNPELFQIYRETVAGILRALVQQAAIEHIVAVTLPGEVGYVRDPATVTDPVNGVPRTQMTFFDDLQPYLDRPLVALDPTGVDDAALAGLDALVVATDVLDEAAIAAVRTFAEAGGTVVLTDTALQALPGLVEGIAAADVTVDLSDINQVDFTGNREDPLLAGLRDITFLLVEPATLGYDTAGGSDTPAWRVASDAWEAAGGSTLGTIAEETAVGQVAVGAGQVTLIGQLLPPPRAEGRIDFGIESYGVLDTGYLILLNALGATLDRSVVDPFGEGPGVAVDRIAGDTRLGTAIAASTDRFADGSTGTVVLARADDFPDALAGGPLAAAMDAPLLLTGRDGLDADVAAEITRLTGGEGTAILLGGEAALSAQVVADVEALGLEANRVAGPDRFATAVAIADLLGEPDTVLLATGNDFPDALSAGAAAAAVDGAVLLTADDVMPPATQAYLDTLPDAAVLAVGGQAAAAAPSATPLVGASRFATAALVADTFFDAPTTVGIATGASFADALAGVPHVAAAGGPMLLAEQAGLPPATAAHLESLAGQVTQVWLYGGTGALGPALEQQVLAALG